MFLSFEDDYAMVSTKEMEEAPILQETVIEWNHQVDADKDMDDTPWLVTDAKIDRYEQEEGIRE